MAAIKKVGISKFAAWMDGFLVMLLVMVVLATVVPCSGRSAQIFDYLKIAAIVLLFFLHGAKLSREAIVKGMLNWRLHFTTLAITFVLFPILGLVILRLPFLEQGLLSGFLYLTILPSTVQSSIAFTSIAKGNVSAAICAATLSNLLGMFMTPLLVAALIDSENGTLPLSLDSFWKISLQLLLPFIVGHAMRPWMGAWVERNKTWIGRTDRSSILLVVYTAFSAAVVDGLWSRCTLLDLITMTVISITLLVLILWFTWWVGNRLSFCREDRIVLLFCGSKKSLATGVPLAGVLFEPSDLGVILLPVMIFHQVQLIVCAYVARRLGDSAEQKIAT